MNVAFASKWGSGLSWAVRLQDEGANVRMWIFEKSHKTIGDGIVPKVGSWNELLVWAKAQQGETLVFFDYSGMGTLAEQARRYGLSVVGGSEFADKLEEDRSFGQEIAASVGMFIPPHEDFSSVQDVLAWCKHNDCGEVYFKPDNPNLGNDATKKLKDTEDLEKHCRYLIKHNKAKTNVLLQQKISGADLSTARWWNGMSWVGPFEGTIENKKFMNGDLGPSTGCSFNAVWFYQEELPRIAQLLNWESLTRLFRLHHAGPGLYDVNAKVTEEGEAYFLEFTPRLGYDSETTSQRLIPNLWTHLWAVGNGKEPPAPSSLLAYSIRLSIPPYPNEHVDRESADTSHGALLAPFESLWSGQFVCGDVRLTEDGFVCGGTDGMIGLSIASSERLGAAHEEALEYAHGLHEDIGSLQFRTDGDDTISNEAEDLQKSGLETHPGLVGWV